MMIVMVRNEYRLHMPDFSLQLTCWQVLCLPCASDCDTFPRVCKLRLLIYKRTVCIHCTSLTVSRIDFSTSDSTHKFQFFQHSWKCVWWEIVPNTHF